MLRPSLANLESLGEPGPISVRPAEKWHSKRLKDPDLAQLGSYATISMSYCCTMSNIHAYTHAYADVYMSPHMSVRLLYTCLYTCLHTSVHTFHPQRSPSAHSESFRKSHARPHAWHGASAFVARLPWTALRFVIPTPGLVPAIQSRL